MSKIIAVHAFNSIPRVAIFAEINGDHTISYVMPNGEKDWDVTFKTQADAQKFFDRELARDAQPVIQSVVSIVEIKKDKFFSVFSAEDLCVLTADAYSYDRYGKSEWTRCIEALISRGYNRKQVEGILRSKWMRWAADAAAIDGYPTAEDLLRWMDDPSNRVTLEEVNSLIC